MDFYPLYKRRGAKKSVACLLVEDGIPLVDPGKLQERARAFHTMLNSLDPADAGTSQVLW